MKTFLSLLFVFFICNTLCGQSTLTTYHIKAGIFFDAENGKFINNVSILIKGNTIEGIKKESELSEEERKYTTIDLSNYLVLPGLIDAHTHLLSESKLYPGNTDASLAYLRELNLRSDALRALYGASRAKAALEAGITGAQDLGNSGLFADVALRDAINLGYVPGPRIRCSGPGLSTQGGQMPGLLPQHQGLADFEYRIVKGVDDAIQAVRENVTQRVDVIKIYADNQPNLTHLSLQEIKAITTEAHRYGIRVTAHATSNTAVYNAVQGGVDAIEHGYQIDDTTLNLMAKKGVVLVPNISDSVTFVKAMSIIRPNSANLSQMASARIKAVGANFKRVMDSGVTIVAGADDYSTLGMPYGEVYKRTLISYVRSGMSITKALQTATINAAKHLRWENKAGVIKKGAWADIIAVDKGLTDTIDALLQVHFVMKGGVVVTNK